jgi:predicted aldo/keto reductase-like oxidoreductase
MFHCVDEDDVFEALEKNGILDYVADLKQKGVVKHVGVSTHTPAMARKMMDLGLIDMMMFSINPAYDYAVGKWAGGTFEERMDLYTLAEQKHIGISVMKIFSGGLLLKEDTSPIGVSLTEHQCMRYALDRPGVVSILPGVTSLAELDVLLGYYDADEEETKYGALKKAAPKEAQGRCVYCSHCAPCPKGIDIPDVFRRYNNFMLHKNVDFFKKGLEKLPEGSRPADCIGCGLCESMCPQHITIPAKLAEIAAL